MDPQLTGPLCASCAYETWLAEHPEGHEREIQRVAKQRQQSFARAELARELGIPPGSSLFRTAMTEHGGEWDGFTLETVGTDPPEPVYPPPWPYWCLISERTGTVGMLKQIWLRRVHSPDTSLVVEARWHPQRDERVAIVGLERMTNLDELKLALRGMRLIRRCDHRGRPPGQTTFTREEFLPLYEQARRDCLEDGRPPTDANLLIYLPVSKATLVRYRNKWVNRE